MVSKAQNPKQADDPQAIRADQLEHAINSTRQLQTTNISYRTAVHKALAELSEPIYAYLGIKSGFAGGARHASRGEASGAEGGEEARYEDSDKSSQSVGSMLTNAAFAMGAGVEQEGASGSFGEPKGPAARAFEGEDSKGRRGTEGANNVDLAVATLDTEPLSVFSYVEMASGFDVSHFGLEPSVRLDVGMTVVSDTSQEYPEIKRLDGSLVSMNSATRGALNFIISTALAYTVVETDRKNIENSQKQPLPYPRSVAMRVQEQEKYPVDPMVLLTTEPATDASLVLHQNRVATQESLATVAA
jgi:hypothetical protein